jgi:hypothetical protein
VLIDHQLELRRIHGGEQPHELSRARSHTSRRENNLSPDPIEGFESRRVKDILVSSGVKNNLEYNKI